MKRRAIAIAVASATATSPVFAGGADDDNAAARTIARAGAVTASADGPFALRANPAGISRRTATRLLIGIGIRDYDGSHELKDGQARIDNRAAPVAQPSLFAATGGERWMIAAGYTESADRQVRTPEPAVGQPPDQITALFPHRYGGTQLRLQNRTVTVGAAVRTAAWLAVGASLSASRIDIEETTFVWAGFSGLFEVGDPVRDLRLSLDGTDAFVAGAAAGAVAQLPWLPVEVAIGISYQGDASATGRAAVARTTTAAFPAPTIAASAASVLLPGHLQARVGARWSGSRFAVELGAAARRYSTELAPSWTTTVEIQDQQSVPPRRLPAVPSQMSYRNHVSLAGSLEGELVPSFLWLVGGYSYQSAAGQRDLTRVGYVEPACHTVAAGLEVYWRQLTLTAGVSRALSFAIDIDAADTRVEIINPFDAGTAPVGDGRFDRAEDRFAISVEIAWDPLADSE